MFLKKDFHITRKKVCTIHLLQSVPPAIITETNYELFKVIYNEKSTCMYVAKYFKCV